MKTAIIVARPEFDNSITNKALINEVSKYPDKFIVHNLDKSAKNYIFDVKKEQELLESVDTIVIQFPTYWFSIPAILKKWFDDVFLYGWAYGSNGDKLKGKKFAIATTLGSSKENYSKEGAVGCTVDDLLLHLKTTFAYVGGEYKGHFALYESPLFKEAIDEGKLKQSSKDYVDFLNRLS